ncbi:hypothetical protein NW762_008840 [Fusarium torreyae]|uniref:Uncharacterized protein n=1 Tax=Fusarium torreyae TaxID=1237075 RepID=A0A9W8RYL0_9HYPO|nr:hypothetical protein NW762_008840 [Fusarium torreyae]
MSSNRRSSRNRHRRHPSPDQHSQRGIGVTLVDEVQMHTDFPGGWIGTRIMQITNKDALGSPNNIMAKVLDSKNTWAGNIDNEHSLACVFKMMNASLVTFIFAATCTSSLPYTPTKHVVDRRVLSLFANNSPSTGCNPAAQQVNIFSALQDWDNV